MKNEKYVLDKIDDSIESLQAAQKEIAELKQRNLIQYARLDMFDKVHMMVSLHPGVTGFMSPMGTSD